MAAATILVVDDDAMVLEVLGQTLRGAGYDVLAAGGPSQALAIVQERQPVNLVLSDFEMPGMRGTQLIREISRISPETGTILMTGGATLVAEVPSHTPVLRKPISTRDLLVAVRDVLARSAQARFELKRQREQSALLREQRMQLRTEFQRTARQAVDNLRKSHEHLHGRAAPDMDTRLRQDLQAAREEWSQASREFDEFCLNVQARAQGAKSPARIPALEQIAARQRASFERFQRALHAFTVFQLEGGGLHSVRKPAGSGPHVTERELEVLGRLAAGKTTRLIAQELNIAFKTVSSHRNNLMQKFDAGNVALLISKTVRMGYIRA